MGEFWYAVVTLPRWEKKIALMLTEMGVENYCPLNKLQKQWKDRKKTVHEPLFKGYVFVKLPENDRWKIKEMHGVVNLVFWLGKPAVIKEEEILVIKKFLHEFEYADITGIPVIKNAVVVIKQGILMDYKGMVIEVRGNKVKVYINSMGVQLTAIINVANLEII